MNIWIILPELIGEIIHIILVNVSCVETWVCFIRDALRRPAKYKR